MTRAEREPLAARMRPQLLDEFIGQEHIIGKGRLLRRAIEADMLTSVIFYGPPGTGKTTLARIIARATKKHFTSLNAVLGGVKEVREAVSQAQARYDEQKEGTILFVDEVHRWNKAQQDALLPWVESGVIAFIGATTHNPFFEINNALLSRSRIFNLKSLTNAELTKVIFAALHNPIRGYGQYHVSLTQEAIAHLIKICNGDARSLLNALQLAVEHGAEKFPPQPADKQIRIDLATAEESIQKKAVLYDRDGDYHYDNISAFIKSVRGSDPDAALYWVAKMMYSGEDPRFIFRRLLILAAEDIGLADPHALVVTEAAASAFEMIGLPEGQFHLSQATIYCALANKSNSTLGYFDALKSVQQEMSAEPPPHIRDSSRDKDALGHGQGYRYPHAYNDHWVAQQYLPHSLRGQIFYTPRTVGFEGQQQEILMRHRALQLQQEESGDGASDEVLSWTPTHSAASRWLERISSTRITTIDTMRKCIFKTRYLSRSDVVFVVGSKIAPYLWAAMQAVPEGGVHARCMHTQEYEEIAYQTDTLPLVQRPSLSVMAKQGTPPAQNNDGAHNIKGTDAHNTMSAAHPMQSHGYAEYAGGYRIALSINCARSFLRIQTGYRQQWAQWIQVLAAHIQKSGYIAIIERLPAKNLALADTVKQIQGGEQKNNTTISTLRRIEEYISQKEEAYQFTEVQLDALLEEHGLRVCEGNEYEFHERRAINAKIVRGWIYQSATQRTRINVADAAAALLSPAEIDALYATLVKVLCERDSVQWPIRYTLRMACAQ